jgi:hypothetical protein
VRESSGINQIGLNEEFYDSEDQESEHMNEDPKDEYWEGNSPEPGSFENDTAKPQNFVSEQDRTSLKDEWTCWTKGSTRACQI